MALFPTAVLQLLIAALCKANVAEMLITRMEDIVITGLFFYVGGLVIPRDHYS